MQTAPPGERIEVPSAEIGSRTQPEAPYGNGPLGLPRRRSALQAWREQCHGGPAAGKRLGKAA